MRRRVAPPPPDLPLITVARDGQKRVLAGVDQAAMAAGLHPGMTVTHARMLLPALHAVDAEPLHDQEDLAKLAAWAVARYSPLVAIDPPNGLIIDATGCAHLFGGERPMLDDLLGRLAAMGLQARAAIADTIGCAHALVRFRQSDATHVVPAGSQRIALASLPIAALRLEDGVVARLARVGLKRIDHLYSMPRAPLTRRFGRELLRRLDQALGDAHEPILPITPPEFIGWRQAFVEPISAPEQLAFAIDEVARQLGALLTRKGLGARQLDLLFHRVDGRVPAIRVGTAAPAREPEHLARLLREKLDTVDPGLGVEVMTLAAPLTEPFAVTQLTAGFAGTAAPADLSRLVDALANRLGFDRLYRLEAVESEVPERSLRRRGVLDKPSDKSWPADWPRPVRLISPPELVETLALLPDHPPTHFTWRGRRHRVRQADGPERIFGEWWKRSTETEAVRDYFCVEDDRGARFWLFRQGDGTNPATGSHRWFIQGLFG